MFNITHIAKHEIGLKFRHGDLLEVLEPGTHNTIFNRDTIEVIDRLEPAFVRKALPVLVRDPALRERLHVIDLSDDECALVWIDGRLETVLGAGLHAFWKQPHNIEIEVLDVDEPRFVHAKSKTILGNSATSGFLKVIDVESHERLLVFDDGELIETCAAGRHAFWNCGHRITWTSVDMREQTLDVGGQEIMTADRVTLRLNVIVQIKVTDPVSAVNTTQDFKQAVYRDAQLALRVAVGGRNLETLLSDKETVGDELRNVIRKRAADFGVSVLAVGIRDIILPGEMKTILNQVIEAQKQSEANLIRRREEVAAARSQANTAKLLADNPVLARMKELEALQDILRGTKASFVFGSGSLPDQVKSLIAGDAD